MKWTHWLLLFLLAACSRKPVVVVVGGGPAGMAAAIEASEGARVILVEGEPLLGGAARYSRGVTAVPSQVDLGRWDAQAGTTNPARTRYVERVHPEVVDWLSGLGVAWRPLDNPLDSVPLLGPEDGGTQLVQAMEAEVRRREVQVRTGVRVQDLRRAQEGWEVGLSDSTSLQAAAVVMATGGFAADLDRVRQGLGMKPGAPLLSGSPAFADGGGHRLIAALGGQEHVPTRVILYAHGVPDPQGRTHMLVGAEGALAVDSVGKSLDGVRAPRGDSGRDLAERGGLGWALFDADTASQALLWSLDRDELVKVQSLARAWGYEAQTPEELDGLLSLPEGTVRGGIAPEGEPARPSRPLREKAPYFALPLRPTTAKVLTGVEADMEGRVLDGAGKPLEGLYAAGELMGFGHPFDGLVLDNTMIGLAVLTGRDAGRTVLVDLSGR